MKPWIKRTVFALCVILVAAVIAAGWYLSNTLNQALEAAFAEPAPDNLRKTRAMER
jgi:hypothetical protein